MSGISDLLAGPPGGTSVGSSSRLVQIRKHFDEIDESGLKKFSAQEISNFLSRRCFSENGTYFDHEVLKIIYENSGF
jgi:hypothetical protein